MLICFKANWCAAPNALGWSLFKFTSCRQRFISSLCLIPITIIPILLLPRCQQTLFAKSILHAKKILFSGTNTNKNSCGVPNLTIYVVWSPFSAQNEMITIYNLPNTITLMVYVFRILRSYLVQLISFFGVITHFKDRPKWAYSWASPSQWAVISNGQSDLPHNLSARRHKHIIQICKTTTEVNLIRCAFKKMYICYAIREVSAI